ncbi:MAG: zinc-binding dehydrogenase [Dehalococcoidia bacterium]|nr:zinc-binding dehydrogenase [Dehalococcoidia bacterium]
MATAMGGNIIGLDIIDERLKLAEQAGAATVVNVGKNNTVEAIRAFTSNDGIELAFETSGRPKGREDVVASLQRGGKSVFVGIGSIDKVINPSLLISKQLPLMGSFVLPLWMAWKLVDVVTSQSLSFDRLVYTSVQDRRCTGGLPHTRRRWCGQTGL